MSLNIIFMGSGSNYCVYYYVESCFLCHLKTEKLLLLFPLIIYITKLIAEKGFIGIHINHIKCGRTSENKEPHD